MSVSRTVKMVAKRICVIRESLTPAQLVKFDRGIDVQCYDPLFGQLLRRAVRYAKR
jgi:hypothetical protein